ncbi:hypothetical protein [Gracilibacillus alcaliphilus]|uniref:hypothetical protein n=1 Tax=Gracilibacillus alcaliphilus TaxID=1401441 RepID=UPI00195B5382|nr:hypothetical protein [Gracilibacillus alcaliphilus]MBM7679557.1 hypothetical protein [Gracilibacillus alcaliphilus]
MRYIKVVGMITKKVYVSGSEAYCHRILQQNHETNFNSSDGQTYPEPLQIIEIERG